MSERKHYARTEGALPVEIYQNIETATNLLDQATTEYSRRGIVFDVERPDSMAQANSILKKVLKKLERGEQRSLAALYVGALLGSLIGVVGNFFVAFWFQGFTEWNILGLIVSGIIFALLCVGLWVEARKYGA